jgi:hypothetical protein
MWMLLLTSLLLPSTGSGNRVEVAAPAVAISTAQAPKPEDVDKLLAPIALYPDQLLAQMLLCAGDPDQVIDLKMWLAKQTLKGTELQDEATAANFEPSFVALVLFPQVVDQLAADRAWTTKLGEVFAANQDAVFASIQRLRAKAQKAGTLKDTTQQDVETRTTSSGQQVIVIEPANPQIVYVPQYNPQVVYVEQDNSADAAVAGLIGFTAGIAIGAAFDNDYYYGPHGWRGGFYMYDDAWDDWYDHREDAREDWVDHREDVIEERGDRSSTRQQQRTERTENRQGTRSETQGQRTERTQARQENRPATQAQRSTASSTATPRASSTERRGYSDGAAASTKQRSGTQSDAFSGYSSGKSERAASQRGQRSRSSSGGAKRGGGGGRR